MIIVLFLAFGPLLTAALIGAVAYRNLPVATYFEENAIRYQTGWKVKIGEVEYPKPNLVRFREFVVLHPQTLAPLARCPKLELQYSENFRKYSATEFQVFLDVKDRQQGLRVFTRMLFDILPEQFSGKAKNLEFNFENVELLTGDPNQKGQHRITFLGGLFSSEAERDKIECSFNLSDDLTAEEPIRFLAERNRKDETSNLYLHYDSDKTYASGKFLSLFLPVFSLLGDQCRFSGTIRAESRSNDDWKIHFEEVDFKNGSLQQISKMLTSYRIDGCFNLGIKAATIGYAHSQGQFLGANGWIQIEDGSIQKELLVKLIDQFSLSWSPTPVQKTAPAPDPLAGYSSKGDIPIKESCICFELNETGGHFRSPFPSGSILQTMRQDQLYLSKKFGDQPTSYAAILYPLMPDNAELVPLTPQMHRIFKFLPVRGKE